MSTETTRPRLQEIDAETQIFTPAYVAHYLVQNSIGRLWMANHPQSTLDDRMPFFVALDEPSDGMARIDSPEEIRVVDPACGTGNLLAAAFDLMFEIYRDAGYKAANIPALILSKNLFGMDIDADAAAVASMVLTVKAHEHAPQFFRSGVTPNVRVLDVAEHPNADLFGSLIREADDGGYHCVIANPPYMGSKHFTPELREFAKANYPESKGDLCTMFIERCLELAAPSGLVSMITMESWMFLSSYERLRRRILKENHIATMAHFGAGVFGSGAVISTTAFVLENHAPDGRPGVYFRLVDDKDKALVLEALIWDYSGRPSKGNAGQQEQGAVA